MAQPKRLSGAALAAYLRDVPDDVADVVLALRDVVLKLAPDAHEDFRYRVPCYFKPDMPYGCIGGNICLLAPREDHVLVRFVHGSFLPDPASLLQGNARHARQVVVRSKKEAKRPELRALILAAVRFTPSADDGAL